MAWSEHPDAPPGTSRGDSWNRLAAARDCGDDSLIATYCSESLEDGDGVADGGDTLIATYSYDGMNRRIRKVVEGDATYDSYYDAGWRVLEIRKDSEAAYPYEQYVWGLRYVHSPVCRVADPDTDGEDVETLYYANDANFNVTAVIETDGTVAERYVYDPYGRATVYNSDWSGEVTWSNSRKNVVLFTGHKLDWETGLVYGNNRYCHTTLGGWITRDPKDANLPGGGYHDGGSLYGYVGAGPTTFLDPFGLARLRNGWSAGDTVYLDKEPIGQMEWCGAEWCIRTTDGGLFPYSVIDGMVKSSSGAADARNTLQLYRALEAVAQEVLKTGCCPDAKSDIDVVYNEKVEGKCRSAVFATGSRVGAAIAAGLSAGVGVAATAVGVDMIYSGVTTGNPYVAGAGVLVTAGGAAFTIYDIQQAGKAIGFTNRISELGNRLCHCP